MVDENVEFEIRRLAKKQIIYSKHAVDRMNSEERLITVDEVREVLLKGRLIEERKIDLRGKNYLFSGKVGSGKFVHVSCSPKEDCLVVVTTYLPDKDQWNEEFSKRKKD